MKTKFSSLILLSLVLFTIVLTNQLVSRVQISLTMTELEILKIEANAPLINDFIVVSDFLVAPATGSLIQTHLPLNFDDAKKVNSTLNLVYLAHSPPILA